MISVLFRRNSKSYGAYGAKITYVIDITYFCCTVTMEFCTVTMEFCTVTMEFCTVNEITFTLKTKT